MKKPKAHDVIEVDRVIPSREAAYLTGLREKTLRNCSARAELKITQLSPRRGGESAQASCAVSSASTNNGFRCAPTQPADRPSPRHGDVN